MTSETQPPMNPMLKLALEIGPMGVFFAGFAFGERLLEIPAIGSTLAMFTGEAAMTTAAAPLFLATLMFMVAIAVSLSVSWALTRSLPRMALVTGVVVIVFGGLTLYLQDETFIKMKPTVVNGVFAFILGFGLLRGRSYLKLLMAEMMPMTDEGWMIFTRRWCLFFIFMALVNELVWRTQSTEFWVTFKTFGGMAMTFVFMMAQAPLLKKHLIQDEAG